MSDSHKQPGHGPIRLSALLPVLAVLVLLAQLAVLWKSDNVFVRSSREKASFFQVQNISSREVESAEAPIGVIREYSFTLESLEHDTTLAFYTVHQYVRVYIDGQMVFSMEPTMVLPVQTIGSNWTLMPLYREDAGKEIRVEIIPAYDGFQDREVSFLVGSQLSICANRLRQDFPQLLLSILSIFIGILLLGVAVYKRLAHHGSDGLICLGVFAVLVGLWRLTDTRFTPFMSPEKPVFLFYFSVSVMMIGVVPLMKSIESLSSQRSSRFMNAYCSLAALVSMSLVLLQVMGIRDIRESFTLIHLMIGLGVAILVGSAAYDHLRNPKDPSATVFFRGVLILTGGIVADTSVYYVRGTSSGLVFSLLAMMIYVFTLGVNSVFRFIRQEKQMAAIKLKLAEQEHQLAESRISAMISQIKPHFIYNTLGSIEQLCELNPEAAARLVHDFALFLRGNFSELDNRAPIPMSQELEHVRCYVRIEQTRFPDMTVEFDIQSEDFLLPALSVQPLVENAVKHGLMKLEVGGRITISTYETDEYYCVQILDTGVGFDTTGVWEDQSHIGLRNIRGRLEAMCGGTLTLVSTPGVGTTATIRIPKEGTV